MQERLSKLEKKNNDLEEHIRAKRVVRRAIVTPEDNTPCQILSGKEIDDAEDGSKKAKKDTPKIDMKKK